VTGLVAQVDAIDDWVSALRRLSTDDGFAEKLRAAARGWVEENFNAHRNAERVLAQFKRVIGP
jgi:glycosyltransferase involved in cell wall biosynthesis